MIEPTLIREHMTTISSCRSCGFAPLTPVLSLGELPLANALLTAEQLDQPDVTYPLHLTFCPRCALVQIMETVDPQVLFGHYLYFSSYSTPLLENARLLTERLIQERHLKETSLVVEIGSNDGYLLSNYVRAGIPAYGIDPAANITGVAEARRVHTLTAFFSAAFARQFAAGLGQADVIHANNVLAHVEDVNDVMSGIALLLKDDGIVSIEVHYVGDLIDNGAFDTIYHEHLCYFSLTSLRALFERHRLTLLDAEFTTTHQGTLRVFIGKQGKTTLRVHHLLWEERVKGMDKVGYYDGLAERIAQQGATLRRLLNALSGSGGRIVAYGVPAKAAVLLNVWDITPGMLDYAVDSTPAKQGRYIPGVHLPIYAPDKLFKDMPDFALLLAWNFADTILEREAEYRRRGGRFIIPIPEVKIV